MLYIHTLQDLNPKIAEIEIVPIIRNMKNSYKIPITFENFRDSVHSFDIAPEDIIQIKNSLEKIRLAMIKVIALASDKTYEIENIRRAYSTLNNIYFAIEGNIKYTEDIAQWIKDNSSEIVELLNKIPFDKTNQERVVRNNEISQVFKKMLRNNNFSFDHDDLVDESHVSKIKNLSESLKEGFLFRTQIQDFIKKNSLYCDIYKIDIEKFNRCTSSGLSEKSLNEVDEILKILEESTKGINVAFQSNMKVVNLSIYLLAFVRWFSQSKVML